MASLPRYRRSPLRLAGAATERKRPARRLAYAAVARRARGRCELCGAAQDPLDPHHAFGRGHLPGIPAKVCEMPELILGVCRPCHDRIHAGDQELVARARLMAVTRFAEFHELSWAAANLSWVRPTDVEPGAPRDLADVMRELVVLAGVA